MRTAGTLRSIVAVMALGLAIPGSAHDSWLEPSEYRPAAGAEIEISLQIGHEDQRRRVELAPLPRWVRDMHPVNLGNGNVGISNAEAEPEPLAEFPGARLYALTTYAFTSELKAEEFNEYLREEGLRAVLNDRRAKGAENLPGREVYHRVAKLIVGDGRLASDPAITEPLGLALEIVPDCDPTSATCGSSLPVRLLFYGAPVEGALVNLNDLNSAEWPSASGITDAKGSASFKLPHQGEWMISAAWSRMIDGDDRGDYETVFSSLAFAIPTGR